MKSLYMHAGLYNIDGAQYAETQAVSVSFSQDHLYSNNSFSSKVVFQPEMVWLIIFPWSHSGVLRLQ